MTQEATSDENYQLSTRGIAIYVALWALIFAVVRVLAVYSSIGAEGSYPYEAGMVTDFGVPIAIGLVLVAVGVAVAYSIGKIRHAWSVAVACFLVGWLAIPVLWVTIILLAALGVLSLD